MVVGLFLIDDVVHWLAGLVRNFICYVESGIVDFANLAVQGVGDLASYVLTLLPTMPNLPAVPAWAVDGYHYVSYWFPVHYGFTLGVTLVGLWVAWLGVVVVLRWAKLVGGRA